MTLYDCAIGDKCKIIRCDVQDPALKDRFMSFGIVRDKKCEVVSHSVRKMAVAVMVDGTQVALRDTEARQIIIERA